MTASAPAARTAKACRSESGSRHCAWIASPSAAPADEIGRPCAGFEVPKMKRDTQIGTSNPKDRTGMVNLLVSPLVPKFAHEHAANSCELRNRDTRCDVR